MKILLKGGDELTFTINWKGYPKDFTLITGKGERWISYPYHHKRLFRDTPEEMVRLQTVQFLVNKMNVPFTKDTIQIEFKMSAYETSNKGRADIVVFAEDENNDLIPLIIVECKSNYIPLSEDVLKQVERYDEVLFAHCLIITNGKQLKILSWSDEVKRHVELDTIPTYDELAEAANLYTIEDIGWKRI
jgi:hypothetical protein